MPGNEVGDRVHNFFGQENLSQGQYHSQAVDGNWPGLSNNLWASSQRQTGAPFISNLKNFNVQQSDSEPGHASSPHLRHGLNLTQSNLRPEAGRSLPQNQQTAVNGYVQGHQVFQTGQGEANILGMDAESDWRGQSRGISALESQQGSGLELYKKNLARSDAGESPVNFDFFGSQQQVGGRHPGIIQSLPRQHSGINDMQLLQQQVLLTQVQELQRQQQFHQLEARQQPSMNPSSSLSKQAVSNHSASLINGIPVEASNLIWQPEVMANNANWLQRGASPVMQSSSNGLMLSPEQGQALRLMGLVPNQSDQSLYGLPISSSRGTPNLYSHVHVDKPAMSHVSIPHPYSHVQGDKPEVSHITAGVSSFPAHQYAAFSDQTNTNDGSSISKSDIQGKSMFGSAVQSRNSGLNMEDLQQVNSEQRNVPTQEFQGRQELAGLSETSQVPPSQSVATLDPTEEKILFGSDDGLWDAFGRNSGALNMLEGTDSFSGLPSVQSGSWSALMQSAVAETSSSDMGIQDEWSGLSFRNNERSPGNDRPSTINSSKQQAVWAENNLQSNSNLKSRSFIRPDDVNRANTAINYPGVPGFHQSGLDASHEQQGRLHTDSSQSSVPQFLERGKWLDCSPQQGQLAEGSHIYGNASNSSGELFNKPNGWNAMKSAREDINASVKMNENENALQPQHENAMHGMGQVPGMWQPDSDTNSSVGLVHVKSVAGNFQSFGEDASVNGVAAVPNLGTTWVNRRSNQQLHSSLNVDEWRDADSSGGYRGVEDRGKYQHHMKKNPLVLESSNNDKDSGEMHGMEYFNKDRPTEGFGSNASYHKAGDMRESVCFDGSDPRSPKSSGQNSQRPPVTRKFQYHPMGVQHVEPSQANKHATNCQPVQQQSIGGLKDQEQIYHSPSKFGHASAFQGDSKGISPGHMPKTIMSNDRYVGNYPPNKTASPRLSETEASDGSLVPPQRNQYFSSQGFGLQLAPPTQRQPMTSSPGSSETVVNMPSMASETGGKGQTWLTDTQTLPARESSHGDLRNNISSTPGQIFEKASQYNVLGNSPQAFAPGFPFPRIHTQNQNVANYGGQIANTQQANVTSAYRTGSMNQIDKYSERTQSSQSELASVHGMSQLNGTDQIHPGEPIIQNSASRSGSGSQPSVAFSALQNNAPSKGLHHLWSSASSKQDPLGGSPSMIPSHPQPNNSFEMTTGRQKPGDEDTEKDGNDLSVISLYSNNSGGREQLLKDSYGQQILPESADSAEGTASASHGREAVVKSTPDASHASPTATSRDIEAFGRTLRPNSSLHQNFSLLHQVQSLRTTENDPSNRDVKRFKVSDNVLDKQHVASLSSSDPNIVNSSTKPGDGQDTNAASEEVLGYGQKYALNVSNNNKATSVTNEHPLISPQMAPSWFERYGAFKNGNILPGLDAQKTTSKIMDQFFIVQNQSDNLQVHNSVDQVNSLSVTSQLGNSQQGPIPAPSVASEHLPSQLLQIPAVEPNLVMRPKKRKTATSELVPWHKELSQGSERLRNISVAELDWARAANRLVEKVEDDAEVIEDLPSSVKSRRRLVLTTQLMQQLLSPPPAAVLSADVKLHHESLVYSVARLVLGDACSSVPWLGRNTLTSPGSENLLPEKHKSSEKVDQYILKVMEDLVGRAKKLESDILRLDSRASILDLRVECQDIERFSVINRFAKFHGRGQNDGVEASSSSDATSNAQKSCPQRYVTAVPMPKNLPDRVQCLSL